MPRMSKSQFAELVDGQGRVEYTLPRMSEEAWSSLSIEAETQAEAEDKAMEEAGDHVFSEHSSEYSLTNGTQDDERVAAETAVEQALVDKVIEEIKGDVHQEDYTALEEMLLMLLRKQGEPNHIMMGYLPEVQVCPGK